jgi:hypothetical protein
MPTIHDDEFPERPESGQGSQEGSEGGEEAVVYGEAVQSGSERDFEGSDASDEEGEGGLRAGALLEYSDVLDDSMVVHDVAEHGFGDSEEEQDMKLFGREDLPDGDEETGNGGSGKKYSPHMGNGSSGKYHLALPTSAVVLEGGASEKMQSGRNSGRLPQSARSDSGGKRGITGTASAKVSPRPMASAAATTATPHSGRGVREAGAAGSSADAVSLDAQPKVEPDIEMGVLLLDIEQS